MAPQTISAATTLSPQAGRDTDIPDLGYHYNSLDYIFGACVLTTNLTFEAGTAVGCYQDYGSNYPSGQPYPICLNNGASVTFDGTATSLCRFARHFCVQEAVNGTWPGNGWMGDLVLNGSGSGATPQITARFTTWSEFAARSGHFRDNWALGTNVYGSTTSNPAMLTVLPLGILPGVLANGLFQLTFDPATGVNYAVEYSTNLTKWISFVTLVGVDVPLTLIDPNTADSHQRFYRIILSLQ